MVTIIVLSSFHHQPHYHPDHFHDSQVIGSISHTNMVIIMVIMAIIVTIMTLIIIMIIFIILR